MGSHAITYAVVALAVAVVCLLAGFSWGRSNVKAQIEIAVEKEHIALDAREFAMRTQLEDTIAEIAKLRPDAEELGRVQKRLEREQAKYKQMKADFNVAAGVRESAEEEDTEGSELAPSGVSADEAIQKLMQSLEAFNVPDSAAAETAPQPQTIAPIAPVKQVQPIPPPAAVAQAPKPAELPKAVKPPQPIPPTPVPAKLQPVQTLRTEPLRTAVNIPAKPAPVPLSAPIKPAPIATSKPASAEPAKKGQQVDEWQEFARQLEALTGKKK